MLCNEVDKSDLESFLDTKATSSCIGDESQVSVSDCLGNGCWVSFRVAGRRLNRKAADTYDPYQTTNLSLMTKRCADRLGLDESIET